MGEDHCVCCGKIVPEGNQVCWSCEQNISISCSKPPSNKQIRLAEDIANTLGIDFPVSSKDFTAAVYWKFINDNIEEASSYWESNVGIDFWDEEIMWFSPLNQ